MKAIDINKIAFDYRNANSRVIFLDYDGTLVPLQNHPDLVKPSPGAELMTKMLAADQLNSVALISGRDRRSLDKLPMADFPITLVAEHGGFFRNAGNVWEGKFDSSPKWIDRVLPSLNSLSFQFEGSFVERKCFSLAWHYRVISDQLTMRTRAQIIAALNDLPNHGEFEVNDSEFTIELRTPGINKGSFAINWMKGRKFDFVLAMGDGSTDEDLFRAFGPEAYTIKVGSSSDSSANYSLPSQRDVLPFLNLLMQFQQQKFVKS